MPVHSETQIVAAVEALSAKRGEIRAFRLSRLSRRLYETMTERELIALAKYSEVPPLAKAGTPSENKQVH